MEHTQKKGYQFHHTKLDSMSIINTRVRIMMIWVSKQIHLPLQERTDEPMMGEYQLWSIIQYKVTNWFYCTSEFQSSNSRARKQRCKVEISVWWKDRDVWQNISENFNRHDDCWFRRTPMFLINTSKDIVSSPTWTKNYKTLFASRCWWTEWALS